MKKKSNAKVTYAPFEIADYLDNEEVIAEYLSAAAQDEDSDVLLKALSDVAKARGMAQVAKDMPDWDGRASIRRCGMAQNRVLRPSPPSCARSMSALRLR